MTGDRVLAVRYVALERPVVCLVEVTPRSGVTGGMNPVSLPVDAARSARNANAGT